MKIDRRSFLALTAGGTVGTALTPLPWKLTDDISIWSQNWPWTPVPPGGEATHVNSTCTLCPAACGITVRKIDQRAVKIEGMAGHPVNDGGICILGVSGLQLLYGPSRVKTPLKRVGDRGAGHWQPISWDQAVAEVAQKLGELREKGEGHTVAAICGSDRGTLPQLFSRLLTVYGSPNFFTLPTIHDTYAMTLGLMQGGNPQAGFDVENTDYLLSFGSGILEGWGAPVRMFRANSRWRSGYGKVVQVEARLSTTAAKADRWMPVNPGSEAALAMGLAHVILREKLYQRDFIKHHTEGFDEWQKGVLAGYAPDAVAAVSGVPAAEIEALAREFARARKPLAIWPLPDFSRIAWTAPAATASRTPNTCPTGWSRPSTAARGIPCRPFWSAGPTPATAWPTPPRCKKPSRPSPSWSVFPLSWTKPPSMPI